MTSISSSRFGFRDDPKPAVGLPVFTLIQADHLRIQRLCDAVVHWAEGDEERRDLFDQLSRELLAHLDAVANAVYNALSQFFASAVDALLAEHRDLADTLQTLERTPMGEQWRGQFDLLRYGVANYARAEVDALHQPARLELCLAEQVALGGAFQHARNHNLKRLGAQS